MTARQILVLEEAADDLQTGKQFYEASQAGIGE